MKPYFNSVLSTSLYFKLVCVECVGRHSNGFGFLDLGVFTKRPRFFFLNVFFVRGPVT